MELSTLASRSRNVSRLNLHCKVLVLAYKSSRNVSRLNLHCKVLVLAYKRLIGFGLGLSKIKQFESKSGVISSAVNTPLQ